MPLSPVILDELPADLQIYTRRVAAASGLSLDELVAATTDPTDQTAALATGWAEAVEVGGEH